jgi:hypothetical protein
VEVLVAMLGGAWHVICRPLDRMAMGDAGWLVLAVVAGVMLAVAWVSRERAIHRRRRRRDREETRG